jgi:hypothetical protein
MELLGIGVSSMQEIQRPPRDDEAASDVCPQCASPDPLLTLMTTWFRYYRCLYCGLVWSVARPGAPAGDV